MHALILQFCIAFVYCYIQLQWEKIKRAVRRDKDRIWTEAKVYYSFDSSIDSDLKAKIQKSMNTLEELTCLQFIPRKRQSDYIIFRSRKDDGCSSQIGRSGGDQSVKIGPGCEYQNIILHEICHALGMWHEQSRPDRDDYVKVISKNIRRGYKHNFLKRNKFEVDSQETVYDYASVMHYNLDSFSKNKKKGLNTLKIIDVQEYKRQGSPAIGDVPTLSKLDVSQLNRLYNCPGSGIPGNLEVYIDRATNLLRDDDAYVRITAYDDQGRSVTKSTKSIENEANPKWKTNLSFGRHLNGKIVSWQYIDVSILDYDPDSSDDEVTSSQSFSVNPGHHNREHCDNIDCDIRMTFSISLTKSCSCFSGGTCLPDGTCDCKKGFGGPRCEYARGQLLIFAKRATNLNDRDSSRSGNSDVYLEIQAYDHNGGITEMYTDVIQNNLNPVWNERIEFEVNEWSWFTVQAWDEDSTGDEKLSDAHTFTLQSFVNLKKQEMKALDKGTIIFDYSFQP